MRIDHLILNEVSPFGHVEIPFEKGTNPDLADVYLLIGPNGSGKSTALYCLAGVIGCGQGNLGTDLGAMRLRGRDSSSVIVADGAIRGSTFAGGGNERKHSMSIKVKGCATTLSLWLGSSRNPVGYYQSPSDHPAHDYWRIAHNFQTNLPSDLQPKFSWAAFAYAGMRSVSNTQVSAIQEPQDSPFESSLSFVNTANTDRLAQWIANQDFKRLKAKEAGKKERAEQLNESIRSIERVVGEIIEEEFSFVMGDDDNNVRVKRNGIVIDLWLLPDGLKSIVSWVADLLMRLDRIPWVDDTPPMKRSFLLLLDEVDIHLHPSWQRKVLPIVQRMLPNAQIIASTHSPFVVASADDAQIITLKVENGVSSVEHISSSQTGVSYSAVLRSIFGIDSEFDIDTEKAFSDFHEAKQKLLSGTTSDPAPVRKMADELASRSEEVAALVSVEIRQLERQLAGKAGK